MKHLGDITKISGYTAPVVDCVIGRSPCQDLSIAGKRAGLEGERSGLFIEQIRIVKEMRKQDERNGAGVDIRPRFMVWENVGGAFSSNRGEDFRIVLEEIAKVKDQNAVIPMPPNGKWTTCGCIVGNGFSIAWRVLDSQFWGVPQRRRRITLIADFGGQSAPEILFVRQSVSGDTDEGKQKGKETSSDTSGSLGIYDRNGRQHITGRLNAYTLKIRGGCEGGGKGALIQTDNTLNAFDIGDVRTTEAVVYCVDQGGGKSACNVTEGLSPTLTCTHGGEPAVCQAVDCRNGTENEINGALQSNCAHSLNGNNVVRVRYIVRRLTPLECERLQGYPDGWTDIGEWTDSNGKKRQTTDSARYKALGNSIALPPWKWVLKRLCACYERDATMASLFDGIGGFPYLWEQLNGKGSCLWASEIEEFPMAVTKARIGGD